MNKLETIGKNIKIHRRALKWTQEQHELFTESEEPKKPDVQKIIVAIDTLIEALDDIRCELCGAE